MGYKLQVKVALRIKHSSHEIAVIFFHFLGFTYMNHRPYTKYLTTELGQDCHG